MFQKTVGDFMKTKFEVGDIVVSKKNSTVKKGWRGQIEVMGFESMIVRNLNSQNDSLAVSISDFNLVKRGVNKENEYVVKTLKLIRKNKKVESAEFDGEKIIIITKPLFHQRKSFGKTKTYLIGQSKIKIRKSGSVTISSISGLTNPNPHCMKDGSICWGNYERYYDNLRYSNPPNYELLAALTISFVENSWKGHDKDRNKYVDIEEWFGRHKGV
jgi:hypothetical protein